MSDFFVGHQAGILLFLFIVLLIALSNLKVLRRLGDYETGRTVPRVSVLVPARNEEVNIDPCVTSLLNQQYPDYEVIVLNDNSTDGTGAILAQKLKNDVRLRVVEGAPLPEGWLGKNWACHQLSEYADGELLLFVDADTQHHELMLRNAVAAQASEQTGLLSAIPRQLVMSWAERLVIPAIPWSILSFLPLALAIRLRAPILSVAVGQFMLFTREAYEAVGGHAAVRLSAVDDLALARRTKAARLRWRLVDGSDRVRCRMYRTTDEVVQGVSRTLFPAFGHNVGAHLFVWLWLAVAFAEPPIVLAMRLAGFPVATRSLWLAGGAIALSTVLWLVANYRFGIPLYLAALYPVSILAVVLIAIRSACVYSAGRVTWRGRQLAAVP